MDLDFQDRLRRFTPSSGLPHSHYSFGHWGTCSIIQQQENIHWFLGLHQAELELQAREETLVYNQRQLKIAKKSIQRKTKRLDWLRRLSWLGLFWGSIYDDIEELERDLANTEYEQQKLEPMLRDAFMEVEVAIAYRDRIAQEHQAELAGKTFQQLQEEYTPIAALESIAKMIAAEVWARQQQFPGVVGTTLADLRPGERQYVLQREAELRLGIETTHAIAHSNQVLSTLPEDQRATILLVAAQLVVQQGEGLPTDLQSLISTPDPTPDPTPSIQP